MLEAEGGKVEDQTTDIPSADTWKDQQKDFTYNIDLSRNGIPRMRIGICCLAEKYMTAISAVSRSVKRSRTVSDSAMEPAAWE